MTHNKLPNVQTAALTDPMAARLGYQLRRVSMLMMADTGIRMAHTGLRPTEATVLLLVGANPGCRQGNVGEVLGIKRANMVPLIAGLIKKGLLHRARADGRSHTLTLTPTGRAKGSAVNRLLDKQDAEYQSRLGQQPFAVLLDALAKLRTRGMP